MFRPALYGNGSTKNFQMENYSCSKYGMIDTSDLYNLQVRKKHSKYAATKQPPISILPKTDMYNL